MKPVVALEQAEVFAPEEPTPLVRDVPPAAPYPVHALGPLKAVTEALHDITQAPLAICAQSALGVASLATQGLANAQTLHGPAPASLFLLTVAESGERKSSCDRLVMKPVHEFETELDKQRERELTVYRNASELWKKERSIVIRHANYDKKTKRAELDALGPEPIGPLLASIVSDAPTFEGITKNLGELRPSLGIFSDEGGTFIGGYSMNAENKLKTMAGLSALWDGSPVSRWRAQDGVANFRGRRVSVSIMVQPVVAAELLSDPMANGQGFLPRFLLTAPPSAIGTRLRVGHMPESNVALEQFRSRIAQLLRRPLAKREGCRNELAPPVLPLSDDACELLQQYYLETEAAQAEGGALEYSRPHASKAAEQAARLAAIMKLYADPDAKAVDRKTMEDAIALATYYIHEAARLCGAVKISPETTEAEKLRRWLLNKWPEPFVSVRAVLHRGPFQLRDVKKARAAIAMLVDAGFLVKADGPIRVDGVMARTVWRVWNGSE